MKTKTVYTASDGTEHDSPQAAAERDLQKALEPLMALATKELFMGEANDAELGVMATGLARNPEALRDAVNAYFEDLEAHPDSPAAQAFDDMVRYGRGVVRIDPEGLVAPQGDPDDPTTWRADLPVDHPNYCRPFGTRED